MTSARSLPRSAKRQRSRIRCPSTGGLARDPVAARPSEAATSGNTDLAHYLTSGQLRGTARRQRVNGLPILKQTDDVVDSNACAFRCAIATPHTRRTNDVTVSLRGRPHTWIVRSPSMPSQLSREALAARLYEQMMTKAEFDEFLTLVAYEHI